MSGERKAAIQRAKDALGRRAQEGQDFFVQPTRPYLGRWEWGLIPLGRRYPWDGTFQSREEVDAYLSHETITCLLCGGSFEGLAHHLLMHGVTSREYKLRFGITLNRGLVSARLTALRRDAVRRTFLDAEKRAARSERIHLLGKRNNSPGHRPRWFTRERGQIGRTALNRWLLSQSIKDGKISGGEILKKARAALPATLPPSMREDIAQEIAVAVCSGTIHLSKIGSSAKDFIVSFNRANREKFTHVSLDRPLYDEGHTTLGDQIASDRFHF